MMENDIIDIPSVKQALYLLNIQPGEHLQHIIDLFCQSKEQVSLEEFTQMVYVFQTANMDNEASVLFFLGDEARNGNMPKHSAIQMLSKLGFRMRSGSLGDIVDQFSMLQSGNLDEQGFAKMLEFLLSLE